MEVTDFAGLHGDQIAKYDNRKLVCSNSLTHQLKTTPRRTGGRRLGQLLIASNSARASRFAYLYRVEPALGCWLRAT